MEKRLNKSVRPWWKHLWRELPANRFSSLKDKRRLCRGSGFVNRIANGFLNLGVKKGDKVAILLRNCLEFPYCWLAANMIGAVMVPVNNRFVGDEAMYILNHSEAKCWSHPTGSAK